MTVDATFVPERNETEVASAVFDTEGVLYHVGSGRLHVLNATAALVWQLCDGTTALGALVDELSVEFGVERTEVEVSVTGLVEELVAKELLVGSRGSG